MSPLKAFRTPGRYSTSEGRASGRRLSMQKRSASPTFAATDTKVCSMLPPTFYLHAFLII